MGGAAVLFNGSWKKWQVIDYYFALIILQSLSKFLHTDWLVAIVYKSKDNKNDVKCNAGTRFFQENKAIPLVPLPCYCKNKSMAVFYGLP